MARQNIFFCNGVRLDSLTDLYDHFNFEDVKNALSSGKMQQWLGAHGAAAECDAVQKVDLTAEDAEIQLLNALNFPDDKKSAYLKKKQELVEKQLREAAEEKARQEKIAEAQRQADTQLDFTDPVSLGLGFLKGVSHLSGEASKQIQEKVDKSAEKESSDEKQKQLKATSVGLGLMSSLFGGMADATSALNTKCQNKKER